MAEPENDSLDFSLDLEAATCWEDAVELLCQLHIAAGEPSRRTLQRWADKNGKPLLAPSTQTDLLSGRRQPRREVVLAFIEGCGVRGKRLEQWEQMLIRVALAERDRPASTKEVGEQRRQVLAEAQAQADQILQQARQEAEQEAARILQQAQETLAQARVEAQKILEEAQQSPRELLKQAETHATHLTATTTEEGIAEPDPFTAAVTQLKDAEPSVRLDGVHALANIADDDPSMRQTCIDALCAYLRLPYDPDPGEDGDLQARRAFRAQREVRHTIIASISTHLRLSSDDPCSWQGCVFDFTSAVFDGGDFSGAEFSDDTVVTFKEAVFASGTVDFVEAEFSGGTVDFRGAVFSGSTVDFRHARFSGSTVYFRHAEFRSGAVYFRDAEFRGSKVDFGTASFIGSTVDFKDADFWSGTVDLKDPHLWDVPPVGFPKVLLPQQLLLPRSVTWGRTFMSWF